MAAIEIAFWTCVMLGCMSAVGILMCAIADRAWFRRLIDRFYP